jgi:hypothetical protein
MASSRLTCERCARQIFVTVRDFLSFEDDEVVFCDACYRELQRQLAARAAKTLRRRQLFTVSRGSSRNWSRWSGPPARPKWPSGSEVAPECHRIPIL